MRVIRVDNYDREIYPDYLVVDGVTQDCAEGIAKELNAKCSDQYYYKVVEDDHKLFEGFEP